MIKLPLKHVAVFLIGVFILAGCKKKKTDLVWTENLPAVGSQSSPRAVDLNDDGILDIVIGAGRNEYQKSNEGILAFDGKTGAQLWQQEAPDQVYGSATFYDVTGDGIKDIFIGGRSPHFKALNGNTGDIIWEYRYTYENDSILKHARFNFNNTVLVPDQNKNGFPELLTVNGGNSKAEPSTETNRFPGVLMLLDSKTGNIIAADTMPDGRESYMSPLCFIQREANDTIIIFGTGGETIDGNLYMANLSDLMNKKLSKAKVIASEKGHGFIASPVLVDISKDGYYDIVAISHGSKAFAIDGKDQKLLWQQHYENTECSNSFAVGYFTDDDVPDFFTFVSKGQWPGSTGSVQLMLDGRNGEIGYIDSMGCTGFSSPVAYDLNHDGRDEVIISINEFDCAQGFTGQSSSDIESKLISIDVQKHSFEIIDQAVGFKNVFSTPWIGDIDDDGYLDIVHCQYYHRGYLLSFLGMTIKRIDTPVKMHKEVTWGAYMGSNGDGTFQSKD